MQPTGTAGIAQTWLDAPTAAKALLIGTFVNRFGGFLQFFLILYLTQRGFSGSQAGLAVGLYGAGAIFGVLVGGWLSDLIGPRHTIVWTMVITAGLTIAILYLDSYVALLAVIAVTGAFCQAFRPASSSMLSQIVPPGRQVMIFSMYRLAVNAATTLSPLVAVVIIQISWNLLFLVEAVSILIYAAIAAVALRGATVLETSEDAETPVGGNYTDVLADRRYLLYLLAVFANTILYVQFLSTLPLMVQDRYNVFHYSVLLAFNGLIVITCELFVTKRVQHWKSRTPILAGIALGAVGMTLFGLPLGYPILVIATLVWTLGEIVGFPMLFETYPAQAGPAHLRGRYLGAANGLSSAGMAVGPVLGIMVYNHIGSHVWFLCGIAGAVALLAGWAGVVPLARDRTDPDPAPGPDPIDPDRLVART